MLTKIKGSDNLIYIYQCYSSARCTHLFDLERTTVHDMFVDFLYSFFHELFSSELNHPIKKKKKLARVAQKRQMINGLNDTYAQPFVQSANQPGWIKTKQERERQLDKCHKKSRKTDSGKTLQTH